GGRELEPDVSVAAPEDLAAEGEPETGTAGLAGVDAEDLLGFPRGHAGAVIVDADRSVRQRVDVDLGRACLERVHDQVAQDRLEQHARQWHEREASDRDLGVADIELVDDVARSDVRVGALAVATARQLEQALGELLYRAGALDGRARRTGRRFR